MGQPNPVLIPTSHLLEIHPNIIHPSTPRSSQWYLSLRFPHQDPTHTPLLTHTCHMPSSSHSSRFYRPYILGKEYKSFGSSLCNLLHSPLPSSFLGSNILLNTMFCSQTPSASFSPSMSHLLHTTNTKTYTNVTSYIFTEPEGLCGNQRQRRELLMLDIVVPETC